MIQDDRYIMIDNAKKSAFIIMNCGKQEEKVITRENISISKCHKNVLLHARKLENKSPKKRSNVTAIVYYYPSPKIIRILFKMSFGHAFVKPT